uniref:BHLH domain-containing protein n=1 Tax=Ixodes ricinus TaxID=34613 RepID=V5HHW1_IXORI
MASCFDALRPLIPPPAQFHRRRGGRSALLRAATEHLLYLEGVLSDLLKDGNHSSDSRRPPRTIEEFRDEFLNSTNLLPPARQRRRRRRHSERSEEVVLSLEDLVPEDPPTTFTGVRGPNVIVRAANVARAPLGDITNAPTGSRRCGDVGSSDRFGGASSTSSRRVDNLDSFYEDGVVLSLPPWNVAPQVVPGSFGDAGDSSSEYELLEALQVVPSADAESGRDYPGLPCWGQRSRRALTVLRNRHRCTTPSYPNSGSVGSEVDWIVDQGTSQLSQEF